MKTIFILLLVVLQHVLSANTLLAEESLLSILLKFSGIAASPSQQKSLQDAFLGDISIVDMVDGRCRQVTTNGKFRSPVFYPDGTKILALSGDRLADIDIATGQVVLKPYHIKEIVKLVGFQKTDFDKVLLGLADMPSGLKPGILSLITGVVAPVRFDPMSAGDRLILSHLENWDRTYDDVEVYVQEQSSPGFGGPIIWTDVFLKQGNSAPKKLTMCNGTSCGQPSLSFDHQQVVYVKTLEQLN